MLGKEAKKKEIFNNIIKIAGELKSAASDGWEFKNYIFGFIFYRYISEKIAEYVNSIEKSAGDDNFDYHEQKFDDEFWYERKDFLINDVGYFISPKNLFKNTLERFDESSDRSDINIEIKRIFDEIEDSSSDNLFKDLFSQLDFSNARLGEHVKHRGEKILEIMKGIEKMQFHLDGEELYGDAFEHLMADYASNAGKGGGESFTPPEVSKLLVKLACVGKKEIKSVYDPACGSGSLLLKFQKEKIAKDAKFRGQEINNTNLNMCRMNMLMHGVPYNDIRIEIGDTLANDKFKDYEHGFDAIVSNPPYSVKWVGEDDPALMNDERYAPAGVLAPKSKGDLAFVMHSLYHLENNSGVASMVCFPGIMFRSGKEQKIREYLVRHNFVDAVIHLAGNLFYGVGIDTCVLIIKKNKQDGKILFVDASEQFEKVKNKNILSEENINWIVDVYKEKKEIEGYSRHVEKVEIEEKEFNLSVNAYVRKKVEKEEINIEVLNKEIEEGSERINKLREEIKDLIKNL